MAPHAERALEILFFLSVPSALMTFLARVTATIRLMLPARISPWEQRRPPEENRAAINPRRRPWQRTRQARWRSDPTIVRDCREAPQPHNRAVKLLGFDKPALKVASAEGARREFKLDQTLLKTIRETLSEHLALARQLPDNHCTTS
jgi:hypothetical protein